MPLSGSAEAEFGASANMAANAASAIFVFMADLERGR
jgi:hypothetical protein